MGARRRPGATSPLFIRYPLIMDGAWAPAVGAGIGAFAVLLGHLLTWMTGRERLRSELAQRDREALLRYAEPLRDRRIDALVRFHELLQDILETGRVSIADYRAVRPHFAYVPDGLREQLVACLTMVSKELGSLSVERRAELLALQGAIRTRLQPPVPPQGVLDNE